MLNTIESLRRNQEISLGPPPVDSHPHHDEILRLRAGVIKLTGPLTEADLTGVPQIILEKPRAFGAVISFGPNNEVNSTFYLPESYYQTTGLPRPRDHASIQFEVGDTLTGLSGQLERKIILNGDQSTVAAYRSRFNIEPQNVRIIAGNLPTPHSVTEAPKQPHLL